MVERWNIVFPKDNSHFNFIVNPACGGIINPTLHYPRTHYSTFLCLCVLVAKLLNRSRIVDLKEI